METDGEKIILTGFDMSYFFCDKKDYLHVEASTLMIHTVAHQAEQRG